MKAYKEINLKSDINVDITVVDINVINIYKFFYIVFFSNKF